MRAAFDSNEEWNEYYLKHKSVDQCYTCHGKPNCIVTVITFGDKATIMRTENGKTRQMTDEESSKMSGDVKSTSEGLKVFLNELK
jgi:hypothetical protein